MNETFEKENIYSEEPEVFTPMKFLSGLACGSKKLLFVVIAYTVSLAASLAGSFGLKAGFVSAIAQFVELMGENLDAEAAEALAGVVSIAGALDSVFLGVAIVSLLPTVLTAVGALLIYLGAKNNAPSTLSKGTLLLHILFTFHTVVCALGIALTTLCVIGICAIEPKIAPVGIIIGIIILVPICISISYYGKFAKMFRDLGTSARTGINVLKVYSLVTVINWVSAIGGLISAVTSFSFSGIGNLLSSIALIIVTMAFSDYKDEFGEPTKENRKAAKEYLK